MLKSSGLLWVILFMLIGGCQRADEQTANNKVAIVDMEQIATAVGFDQTLKKQLDQFNQQAGQHLQQVQDDIRKQLKLKQNELGDKPTKEQLVEIQKLSAQLDNQYRQALSKAQQNSNQLHATLVGQFRQKVDPIIQAVAKTRGVKIVLSRSESIVMVSPQADITADVLMWLQQSGQSQLLLNKSDTKAPAQSNLAPVTTAPVQQLTPKDEKLPLQDKLPVE